LVIKGNGKGFVRDRQRREKKVTSKGETGGNVSDLGRYRKAMLSAAEMNNIGGGGRPVASCSCLHQTGHGQLS
jgi:hypothetical protein